MTGPAPRTVQRIEKIRVLRAAGHTQTHIASQLGISQEAVCSLIKKYVKHYSHPRPFAPEHKGETLYDRWINDHDIRGIGERAVRETA